MVPSPKNEKKPSSLRNKSFLIETIYIATIITITILIFLDLIETGFFLGPLRFSHWMGIIGAFFILIFSPLYYFMKRRYPNRRKILLNIHIFGFTTSFLLVSIHFAGMVACFDPIYKLASNGGKPSQFLHNLLTACLY